jgi:hypothetical protein
MALTVRPDDEVYQFDTVWLGPDEYTLPIQARYVAWGTWLACFLVAAAVLVPLGGAGPGGVLGSLMWSLALSVVASRAVMLVVDHERPLRSLPALFSAEAQAALAAGRRAERSVLLQPARVRVREVPERARQLRDRKRRAELRRLESRGRRRRVPAGVTPATLARPGTIAPTRPEVLPASAFHAFQTYQAGHWVPAERAGPVWAGRVANADGTPADDTGDWDDGDPGEQPWYPARPTRLPAGSLPPMRSAASPGGTGSGPPGADRPAGGGTGGGDHSSAAIPMPAGPVPAGPVPAGPVPAGAGQPRPASSPADSRRPIEERILLPVRKVR